MQSFIMLECSSLVMRFTSFSRSSQYSVSAHSFKEIAALTRNSFLLTEYWASERFAPMEVPERKSCSGACQTCKILRLSAAKFIDLWLLLGVCKEENA